MEPTAELSERIKSNSDDLAQRMVKRHYEMQPGVWEKYGRTGYQRSLEDAKIHLSFLSESLALESPIILTNYVEWAAVLFDSIKLPGDTLRLSVSIMGDTVGEILPADLKPIFDGYIAAALEAIRSPMLVPPSFIDPASAVFALADGYLNLLLKWNRAEASKLVLDAADAGLSLESIYMDVLEPVQKEIGRLWQTARVSVAQEHFCSATTQSIMAQFYPRLFSTPKNGHTMVATCVSRELHEMGIRMVSDIFELRGWSTYYLGANTPKESILATLKDRKAEVLCVSTTMGFQLEPARELISAVRSSALGNGVVILVGGYPFNLIPDLWQKVKADGFAANATAAVELARHKLNYA